jgi:hypothetical protein
LQAGRLNLRDITPFALLAKAASAIEPAPLAVAIDKPDGNVVLPLFRILSVLLNKLSPFSRQFAMCS